MGTNSFISKVTPLGSATTYTVKDPIVQEIIIGTQTASTGSWTGKSNYINALYDGLTIKYYLPYAGSGNATLNLTLADNTTTGAINCYYGGNSRLTTHFGAGSLIILTYFSAGSISVSGTATTDARWYAQSQYDTNDTGYYHRKIYPNMKAGSNTIYPYTVIMQNKDGRWESLVSSNPGTGNNHAVNTHGFTLGNVFVMYANATYAENANIGTYNVWSAYSGLIDVRYSFNLTSSTGFVGYKPVYIVGTIGTDGLFYLDTTQWWSQTLPSTDDGKVYVYIGDAYDWYRITLEEVNPAYFYRDSRIQMYAPGRGIKGISRSGTTFTVTRDDGSTFTFTQQDSNTTSFTITANATDGIWDLTGTNGTNAVTYAVAPYSSQQSKASFDTSSTNPTRTDRLNYNGYLYATKLYSGGAEVLTSHQSLSGYIPKSTLSGAYDIMYSSAANTPTRLGANTTTTKKFLRMTGTGSAGAAPAWDTVTKSDVGLGNVENTALSTWAGSSNITTIGTLSSGTVPWARLSNVPSASTSTAGIIQIGSGASNAAAGNHTHTTSIATDSGTNQITLALGTKYKLTAGGTSYIFTMPSNPNTDTKVTQTNTTSDASEYRVLLSGGANDTTETTTARKNTNLRFNPSTNILSVGGSISATGDLEITGDAYLNGETYADSITAASLIVTGAASFTNIPTAPTPATSSNDTSIATTAFVKNNLGGLSGAMHFKGTTTTTMSDGLTTAAVTIGGSSYTPSAGDVVLYDDSEFVWTGSAWERLGRDSSFKVTQTAVTGATTASTTTTTTFVSAITQDTNGVIKYTTQPLPTYNNYSHPTTTSATVAAVKVGRDTLGHVVLGNAITYSDVGAASAAHAHGNITNDGKVGSTADYALHTTTGGAVTASSFAVTSPSASGSTTAFIDTISQDSKGKISATKKNITAATTSTAGIWAMSSTNANTLISQLPTWTAIPTDDTYLIRRDTGGAASYGQVKFSTIYSYINNKLATTNNTVNLSYNTESTIATIGGVAIKVKLPASDNTDTKNTAGSTDNASKLFLIGATAQAANPQTYSNSAVYVQAGAFAATSVKVAEKVTLQYNNTTNALDFIFA